MPLFSKKLSDRQLEYIKNSLAQLQDSATLINSTLQPDVFFRRLNFVLDILLDLQQYEKYGIFKSGLPSRDYNRIIDNIELTVDNFIDRSYQNALYSASKLKTDKGRSSRMIKYFSAMEAAFELSHTFWTGDNIRPHYTGPLFTSANREKLKSLEETDHYMQI